MLQQIKLNFKILICKERAMSLLFVVVQLLSIMTIYFSYGIINHFNTKADATEGITTKYRFEIHPSADDSQFIRKEELISFFNDIIPVLKNKIQAMFSMGNTEDGITVITSFGYGNNNVTLSPLLDKDVRPTLISGRLFNEDELQDGAYVAVVGNKLFDGQDSFFIGDNEYKKVGIIEHEAYTKMAFVPYQAMPDNCNKIAYFSIQLTQPLLENEYEDMVFYIKKYIGDKVPIPEFDGIKNPSFTRVYNDLLLVTVILMVVCAFNYCIIYRFILEKRRKNFAISRICGCTRFKAVTMYMIELLTISFVTLGIGVFIYLKLLLPEAVNYFEYIEYYYTATDNLKVAITYVISLFAVYLVLVTRFVSTTPANLVRGCK